MKRPLYGFLLLASSLAYFEAEARATEATLGVTAALQQRKALRGSATLTTALGEKNLVLSVADGAEDYAVTIEGGGKQLAQYPAGAVPATIAIPVDALLPDEPLTITARYQKRAP